MPRRYRRYRSVYVRPSQRYSVETQNINISGQIVDDESTHTMIGQIESQGLRKAKNFTLNLSTTPFKKEDGTLYSGPIAFALVYVPQGTTPSHLTIGTANAASLYEPNQNVILSGVYTAGESSLKTVSSLARNLNSGDSIKLILKYINQKMPYPSLDIFAQLSYAITF